MEAFAFWSWFLHSVFEHTESNGWASPCLETRIFRFPTDYSNQLAYSGRDKFFLPGSGMYLKLTIAYNRLNYVINLVQIVD